MRRVPRRGATCAVTPARVLVVVVALLLLGWMVLWRAFLPGAVAGHRDTFQRPKGAPGQGASDVRGGLQPALDPRSSSVAPQPPLQPATMQRPPRNVAIATELERSTAAVDQGVFRITVLDATSRRVGHEACRRASNLLPVPFLPFALHDGPASTPVVYAVRLHDAAQGGVRRIKTVDELRRAAAQPHNVVSIECLASQTFLSRTTLREVVVDKTEARSAEKWTLVVYPLVNAIEQQNGVTVMLVGVVSSFQPDADEFCVAAAVSSAATSTLVVVRRDSGRCAQLLFEEYSTWAQTLGGARIPVSATKESDTMAAGIEIDVAIVATTKPLRHDNRDEASLQLSLVREWGRAVRQLAAKRDEAGAGGFTASFHVCVEDEDDVRVFVDMLHAEGLPSGRNHGPMQSAPANGNGGVWFHTDCERHPLLGLPTYRGLFAKGEAMLPRRRGASPTAPRRHQFVAMVNADVLLAPRQLEHTLIAAAQLLSDRSVDTQRVLITGRRWNCRPELLATYSRQAAGTRQACSSSSKRGLNGSCVAFNDDAQDYFILNAGALEWSDRVGYLSWSSGQFAALQTTYTVGTHAVPPLVVGGVAFDNWLVAAVATSGGGVVVDATPSLDASHFSHAALMRSHTTAASRFNSEVAHYCGGWAMGKLSSQRIVALPVANAFDAACCSEDGGGRWLGIVLHQRGVLRCAAMEATGGWCNGSVQASAVHACRKPMALVRPHGDAFDRPWDGHVG